MLKGNPSSNSLSLSLPLSRSPSLYISPHIDLSTPPGIIRVSSVFFPYNAIISIGPLVNSQLIATGDGVVLIRNRWRGGGVRGTGECVGVRVGDAPTLTTRRRPRRGRSCHPAWCTVIQSSMTCHTHVTTLLILTTLLSIVANSVARP
jgi:hypothetical protein